MGHSSAGVMLNGIETLLGIVVCDHASLCSKASVGLPCGTWPTGAVKNESFVGEDASP
ncbi:hypothetical protein RESH_02241 [Rhodopirellula europaea SH398]|uniref:Uncharacterized protein n=1 Tax=Rhodopirellula europaea SH398 TaxID=1263868 RepID=M5SLX7_9BACT|nr:hypothetical protein RESH_02241 [Rhodopirellula europaea SH398]